MATLFVKQKIASLWKVTPTPMLDFGQIVKSVNRLSSPGDNAFLNILCRYVTDILLIVKQM